MDHPFSATVFDAGVFDTDESWIFTATVAPDAFAFTRDASPDEWVTT